MNSSYEFKSFMEALGYEWRQHEQFAEGGFWHHEELGFNVPSSTPIYSIVSMVRQGLEQRAKDKLRNGLFDALGLTTVNQYDTEQDTTHSIVRLTRTTQYDYPTQQDDTNPIE